MYKIIRFYSKMPTGNGHMHIKRRTIKTGLTKEEARAHCPDPETSSRTCTSNRVRGGGSWFDGYEET